MVGRRPRSLWPKSEVQEAYERYKAGEGREPWWRAVEDKGRRERRAQALMRGIGFALERGVDIDPWTALKDELRRCHHRIIWVEARIAETAQKPEDLLPGGAAYAWLRMQYEERKRLVEVSKIALAAGLAAQMIAQVEFEAQTLYDIMSAGLDAVKLDDDQRFAALEAMAVKHEEIENAQAIAG